MDRKLCLSPANKVIAGVCAGFADYFKVDATFIRILFVVFMLVTYVAPAAIIYIVCWAVMPLPEN